MQLNPDDMIVEDDTVLDDDVLAHLEEEEKAKPKAEDTPPPKDDQPANGRFYSQDELEQLIESRSERQLLYLANQETPAGRALRKTLNEAMGIQVPEPNEEKKAVEKEGKKSVDFDKEELLREIQEVKNQAKREAEEAIWQRRVDEAESLFEQDELYQALPQEVQNKLMDTFLTDLYQSGSKSVKKEKQAFMKTVEKIGSAYVGNLKKRAKAAKKAIPGKTSKHGDLYAQVQKKREGKKFTWDDVESGVVDDAMKEFGLGL